MFLFLNCIIMMMNWMQILLLLTWTKPNMLLMMLLLVLMMIVEPTAPVNPVPVRPLLLLHGCTRVSSQVSKRREVRLRLRLRHWSSRTGTGSVRATNSGTHGAESSMRTEFKRRSERLLEAERRI